MKLKIVPVTLREANAYVGHHHRHSDPVRGCLFCVGLADDEIRGVAIVGRPVARALQDGFTAEILRVCTDGVRNGCSMLYGACWRGAQAMGYTRAITYTLAEEGGSSLRASGWQQVAELSARKGWDAPSRRRANEGYRSGDRFRWEKGAAAVDARPDFPEGVASAQESLPI